jgi:chromosome segregation ATPase
LNRSAISIELRRKSAERFEREQIDQLTQAAAQLEEDKDALLRENEELRRKCAVHEKAAPELTDDLLRLRAKCEDLENKVKQQNEVIERRDSELVSERNALAELRAQMFSSSDDIHPKEPGKDDESQIQIEGLQREKEELKQQMEQVRASLKAVEATIENRDTELRRLNDENDELKEALGKGSQKVIQIQAANERLLAENEQHQQMNERQTHLLDEMEKEILQLRSFPQQHLPRDNSRTAKVVEQRLRTLEERIVKLTAQNEQLSIENVSKREEIERLRDEDHSKQDPPASLTESDEHLEELELLKSRIQDLEIERVRLTQIIDQKSLALQTSVQSVRAEMERKEKLMRQQFEAERSSLQQDNKQLNSEVDRLAEQLLRVQSLEAESSRRNSRHKPDDLRQQLNERDALIRQIA